MKKEFKLIAFGVEDGRIFLHLPYMNEHGEWTHSDNFIDVGVACRLIEELSACLNVTSGRTVNNNEGGSNVQSAVALSGK